VEHDIINHLISYAYRDSIYIFRDLNHMYQIYYICIQVEDLSATLCLFNILISECEL